jgi:uncharacterized protein YgiM (DUF1202 family)
MKKLLLMMTVLFFTVSYAQDSRLTAICCDAKPAKSFGRCSGDAYCTACTNCRYCKHCNSGGTCGVCTSYAAPVKKKTVKKAKAAKSPSFYRRNQMLEVTSETLNVREGAGTSYDIIETLSEGDMLTFISYEGEWLYVRVDASGETGYVNYKYVK